MAEDSVYKTAARELKSGIDDHDEHSIAEILSYILGEPKEFVLAEIRKCS